ncbi:MAG: hypothetical protein WDW36_009292 [Sanguina aurantia]
MLNHKRMIEQARAEAQAFFLGTKLNVLLLALPFAVVSHLMGWGDASTFTLSWIALIPLAERLGFVTEQMAMYTNDTVGGLLNASFGNATEVIISGFALSRGYLRVVQLSLLGSIVSNLLLVLGSAFLAGGIRHKSQGFNQQGVNINSGLLVLSVVAVLLPSLLAETHTEVASHTSELALSRFESLFLIACYGLYLVFQLCTHRHLYEEMDEEEAAADDPEQARPPQQQPGSPPTLPMSSAPEVEMSGHGTISAGGGGALKALIRASSKASPPPGRMSFGGGGDQESQPLMAGSRLQRVGAAVPRAKPPWHLSFPLPSHPPLAPPPRSWQANGGPPTHASAAAAAQASGPPQGSYFDGGSSSSGAAAREEGGEKPELSVPGCVVWMALVTLLISLLSEYIMSAIKGASEDMHIPLPFLVTILLPIVGNAAEHSSAVVFAYKNRIEVALGVAIGSATQIAALVMPGSVLLAWAMGQPLDLNFNSFETATLFITVLLTIVLVMDGVGNYLKGVMLILTYIFVAAGFWFHKDHDLTSDQLAGA